jgi:hypothetical protein
MGTVDGIVRDGPETTKAAADAVARGKAMLSVA